MLEFGICSIDKYWDLLYNCHMGLHDDKGPKAGKGQGSLESTHPQVLQSFAACQVLKNVEKSMELSSARNNGIIPG